MSASEDNGPQTDVAVADLAAETTRAGDAAPEKRELMGNLLDVGATSQRQLHAHPHEHAAADGQTRRPAGAKP